MDKGLHELAVVHGAYAGDKAEQQSDGWAGCSRQRRHGRCRRGSHTRTNRRGCAMKASGQARFAIDDSHHIAFAVLAERLPASSAERDCRCVCVYGAVHIWAPSLPIMDLATMLPSRCWL